MWPWKYHPPRFSHLFGITVHYFSCNHSTRIWYKYIHCVINTGLQYTATFPVCAKLTSTTRDLRFSQQWRCKSTSSQLWHCVALQWDTNAIQCHNPEDLNPSHFNNFHGMGHLKQTSNLHFILKFKFSKSYVLFNKKSEGYIRKWHIRYYGI